MHSQDYNSYEIEGLAVVQSILEFTYTQKSQVLHSLKLAINVEKVKSLDLPAMIEVSR